MPFGKVSSTKQNCSGASLPRPFGTGLSVIDVPFNHLVAAFDNLPVWANSCGVRDWLFCEERTARSAGREWRASCSSRTRREFRCSNAETSKSANQNALKNVIAARTREYLKITEVGV